MQGHDRGLADYLGPQEDVHAGPHHVSLPELAQHHGDLCHGLCHRRLHVRPLQPGDADDPLPPHGQRRRAPCGVRKEHTPIVGRDAREVVAHHPRRLHRLLPMHLHHSLGVAVHHGLDLRHHLHLCVLQFRYVELRGVLDRRLRCVPVDGPVQLPGARQALRLEVQGAGLRHRRDLRAGDRPGVIFVQDPAVLHRGVYEEDDGGR
mmetsp:Transcript_17126/g.48910  ORF Transcript_17126/g.48910 Transcript_17126/m.48910 type:complete len:205 (+) Transcript_17126:86-700(+)